MKRLRFPKRVKRGSCVVTIYKTPTNGYASFTVVHYDANGTRCRRSSADYKRARQAALEVASKLSEGRSDILVLTGQKLLVYRRAMKALRPTRTSLDTAAVWFAELMQRNNGDSVNNVATPAQRSSEPVQPKLVSEVLKELLAAKEEKGRSQLYLTDLRVRLTRFAEAMARPLSEVMAADIDGFLRSLELSARSQNNFRATIGTLFRFGQTRGYVPREHPCVSNVEKASHTAPEIQVFTSEEIEKLLRMAKPRLVPALALGAFAGIRSEEIKKMHWDDFIIWHEFWHIFGGHLSWYNHVRGHVAISEAPVGPTEPGLGMSLQALERDADGFAMYCVLAQALEQADHEAGEKPDFVRSVFAEAQHAVKVSLMCGIVMLGAFWQPSGSVEKWPSYCHPPAGVCHLSNFSYLDHILRQIAPSGLRSATTANRDWVARFVNLSLVLVQHRFSDIDRREEMRLSLGPEGQRHLLKMLDTWENILPELAKFAFVKNRGVADATMENLRGCERRARSSHRRSMA